MILMHLLFPASSCGYVLHFLKLIASHIQFTQPVLSVYAYLRLNTQRVPTDGKPCSPALFHSSQFLGDAAHSKSRLLSKEKAAFYLP